MSTTIESLELEILSSSQSAESGLDRLTASLEKLKTATKGGLGLSRVAKNIRSVADATNSINSGSVSNVNGLAKAIQLLGGTKISSTIATQITAMSTALSGADFSGSQEKLKGLADALAPLSALPKTNLASYVNNLKKLPDALNNIDTRALYEKIHSVTRILKPFADEMQKVANGFAAFPTKIQKLISSTERLSASNEKASSSYIDLWAGMKIGLSSVRVATQKIGAAITEMNNYIENVNLFTVSMGEYASEARAYAEGVGEVMGIDPGEWMRNQGVFMTLATGFGVVGDRAYTMSQQLTQLGYDLSSFFNISYEDAMQKLQSGLSGELEPLRRLGYDLSQAKLEAVALSLGIDKSVSSMTQAEKAQLRYYAIMTQVTKSHGDMSRTLDAPANQMRIFKAQVTQAARAIGGIFIPMLNAILPYAIAVAKIIQHLGNAISTLVGFEMPDMGDLEFGTAAGDFAESFDEAEKSAKKLKSYMLGFDELNVINPDDGNGSGIEDTLSQFDFELPTYDFIGKATDSRVAQIVDDMKEWLGITEDVTGWAGLLDTRFGKILISAGAIGTALALWKVTPAAQKAITALSKLKSNKLSLSLGIVGVTTFLADIQKLKDYIADFSENGATFSNVSGIISEFAGLVGDAMIVLGNVKTGGALKAVQGIGEIVSALYDMSQNGVNFENITDAIRGMSNLGIAVGLLTGHLEITGISMVIQGFTDIIHELAENWDAIKNGDWSGVDKATLAIGAIEVIGGIATAIIGFNKIKGIKEISDAGKTAKDVADVTESVSTTTSTLTTKLTNLVKNLGLGIVIIAEVAAAAALVVGAIWLLGVELEKVGIAWQPVIDNAETVSIAVGIGTGLLVAIGVATALLGTLGGAMCAQLGIGVAVLALIGAAAVLFIAEIWAIGKLLDEVGKAWQPVLDKGNTIATAIGVGTGILVGVGVVAALLGVAATATAGALPLAIALGTAMLLELGVAAALFLAEILVVGGLLDEIGTAWQPVLDKGKTIETGIATGTALLIAIGVVCAALGTAAIASVGLLPLAIAAGTGMLVQLSDAFGDFTDALSDVADDIKNTLAPALTRVNGVMPTAKDNMNKFVGFMTTFAGDMVIYTASSAISGIAATINKFIGFFTTDPFKQVASEVDGQYSDMQRLITNLKKTVPMIEDATKWMRDYNRAMSDFNKASGSNGTLGGIINSVVNTTVNIGVSLAKKGWDSISTFVGTGVKVGVSLIKDGWNSLRDWIGNLSTTLGIKLPKIGIEWGETKILGATFKYPKGFYTYAQGGFPDFGQMFIAREAGPELVGTIGNRNAVVNNDQIVESVSTGVYQAVVAALGSGSDEGGDTQIVINLDGEKIYENQQKVARNRGYNLGMGAFSFG